MLLILYNFNRVQLLGCTHKLNTMQLLQEEIISQYLDEMPVGIPPQKEQSKWAAKIELSKQYSPEQIEQLEYEYHNRKIWEIE